MGQIEEIKVDAAIEQADANNGFEGMRLTPADKQKIKQDLEENKSLLISFFKLCQERKENKEKRKK